MTFKSLESLKIRAKLLQKRKRLKGVELSLKEALNIVATAAGYDDWRELKASWEISRVFCPKGSTAFWKIWFATYEEAVKHLNLQNQYLIPFQKQYFICDEEYLNFLGLAEDVDVKKIGRDWVNPKDLSAWARILSKLKSKC